MEARTFTSIVIGGSGATGRHLVNNLLSSIHISRVTVVGRKDYDCWSQHPGFSKLHQVKIDFNKHLIDREVCEDSKNQYDESYDIGFCNLGTTRADAGSDEAFRLVDYTYVLNFATLCKNVLGVRHFHLVSSVGADHKSWFLYPRTKGEIENAVKDLKFDQTVIYRPPLLVREKPRMAEVIGGYFIHSLSAENCGKIEYLKAYELISQDSKGTLTMSSHDMEKFLKNHD